MKISEFIYIYKGKEYLVHVEKHYQRNTYFRYKDDGFYVSSSLLTSQNQIIKFLDKYAGKLLAKHEQRNSNYSFDEGFVYVFGEKVSINEFGISDEISLQKALKSLALNKITELVRTQEEIMGIKEPYKISIRKTTGQFGSNSKQTHTLSFQLALVHYSPEIINSVVVHELAHEFHRNHQKEFYNCVYKYCPDYKQLQNKLKKGVHK